MDPLVSAGIANLSNSSDMCVRWLVLCVCVCVCVLLFFLRRRNLLLYLIAGCSTGTTARASRRPANVINARRGCTLRLHQLLVVRLQPPRVCPFAHKESYAHK